MVRLFMTFWLLCGILVPVQAYDWRMLRVGESNSADAKRVLGEPSHEYREQLLYENQRLDSDDPNLPPVRLNTVVFNLAKDAHIESIFLFPMWGTTDRELRPLFGEGERMRYKKFLTSLGELKLGAGTRPDEKLHYIDLNALCEVYSEHRILVIYDRRDVVSGNDLVKIILFY